MVQFTKLRLSGFKSFVEPTELDIGHGLTGIVGPNGCGKSNLVEALRWAMGENSPKRMRSSDMDDVIFNGTDNRPARNTAEVVLSLDNADRTAPAEINDADDLEVSRKIERDVGSTYKINGKTVRMRDVQLLFADSSIGAHSPAMVSQGRVADMINAKPQQRRMVLEEAAGISGLHARRHEAELKLRAAETNLLRVEDVLGAMNTQLENLKKQARQASRYRNLSGHIQNAEGGLLYLRWKESTSAVEAALRAFDAAESIVREKTLVVADLTTRQTEAAAGLPQLRQNEAEAAAVLQRFRLAYGSLESEERQVTEERTKSEHLAQQFASDVAHEKAQKAEANDAIRRLQSEAATLSTEAATQSAREEEAKTAADETAQDVENAETRLAQLTEEVATQDAARHAAERHVGDLDRRLSNIIARKNGFEEERAALIAATPAKAALEQIETNITAAEEIYAAATANLDAAEADRTAADSAFQTATETFQAAQNDAQKLAAEAAALRRLLHQAQADFEPVLDQIRVEAGFEKALAAAFGEDVEAALDQNAPTHWRALPPLEHAASLPAGIAPLSQFVQGPDALARRLSQIGVVETGADAESLFSSLAPGQCLVSKDGGAWRWDGLVVTPGSDSASAIRLEQKNRLQEVEALIVAAETAREAKQFLLGLAKEKRAEAQDTLATARNAARSAEETLNGLRRRHSKLSAELTEVTAKLSSLSTSIANAAEEISTLTLDLDAAREAFAALPDTAESRAEIAALKTSVAEKRQKLATQQAIYAEIRREGENRARRLSEIERDVLSWNGRIERTDLRLLELEDRIAQAQAVIDRLAGRPAEIAAEKQILMDKISDAEQKRQTAADTLVSAETAANDLHRELRASESALSDAREARAMAQASVNTSQHTQNGVEAQIGEKFTCSPEELVAKLELAVEELPAIDDLHAKLERLLRERDNMGPVNLRAEVESQEITDQMTTMQTERDDLVQAIEKLREGIGKLNKEARERLLNAFDVVNTHFQKLFTRLFQGGAAHLKLIEADDPLEAGLEIYAQPPGKKLQVLSLLSGGEQTLTSIALIFAMFLTNPAPICVLDEVDAPLDESNVDRYCTLLEDLSKECKTRFIVVTHHRMTMARMDRLYGVTMSERGVSQLVSVDLKQHALELEAA